MSELKQKAAPKAKTPTPSIQSSLWHQRRSNDRVKLTQEFARVLCEDFDMHGPAAIEACRMFSPDVYVRVIASLMPKEIKVSNEQQMSNDELESALLRYITADISKLVSVGEGRPLQIIDGEATQESPEQAGRVSPLSETETIPRRGE